MVNKENNVSPELQAYLDAEILAKRDMDTAQKLVRNALDAALDTTKDSPDSFYIQTDKLVDEEARKIFKERFSTDLTGPYRAGILGMPGDLNQNRELFMSGWYGFNSEQVGKFVNDSKDQLSFESFMDYLSRRTNYQQQIFVARSAHANSLLDRIDNEEVLRYVGVTAVNSAALTEEDKIDLLRTYKTNDVVPLKPIKDKLYMKE